MSLCSLESTPPMHSMIRICAMPCLASSTVKPSMTSCVCLASSRLGQRISPTGPSPPSSGILCSSIIAAMIMGRTKVNDLPDPVNAIPMMSRPLRITGRPWIWIGVGRAIPFRVSSSIMGLGNFISRKVLMGGGMSTPSTMMCHLSRTSSRSSSVSFRMCAGAFQPVSIDWVYATSLESSCTDMSAFLSLIDLRMAASSCASFSAGVMDDAMALSPAARDRSDVFSFGGANSRMLLGPPGSSPPLFEDGPAASWIPGDPARSSPSPPPGARSFWPILAAAAFTP
mmetsp:Transcript_13892/g.58836  ORF Transcript_13892/g.58836 Transcript_13892/m.58836 type:complete len:284 (-) Transcript_13892:237-1088(-)